MCYSLDWSIFSAGPCLVSVYWLIQHVGCSLLTSCVWYVLDAFSELCTSLVSFKFCGLCWFESMFCKAHWFESVCWFHSFCVLFTEMIKCVCRSLLWFCVQRSSWFNSVCCVFPGLIQHAVLFPGLRQNTWLFLVSFKVCSFHWGVLCCIRFDSV